MKKVIINTNHTGLVMKKGELIRVLRAGSYWLGFGESVEIHDMNQPFKAGLDVDVLLLNDELRELVHVVEVPDNELVVVYQNQNLKSVLNPGKYVFWKGVKPYAFIRVDLRKYEITEEIDVHLFDRMPMAHFVRSFRVEPHEQALLFVDGKLLRILEAGVYQWWKNSTVIQVVKADMRRQTLEIGGQEMLTRDKAQLRINFTLHYKVTDIIRALAGNKEYEKQLYIITQLALRAHIGRMSLDELMDSKDQISDGIQAAIAGQVEHLGVEVLTCGVKDIILPGDVKEIMNQVLIAEKRAQANIITRREETASARSLLNTAKLMEDSAMLQRLKEMEYVEKIADKISSISVSGSGQIIDQLKQIFIK